VVLDGAYQAHAERFVRQPPKPLPLPSEVWINKPVPPGQKTKKEGRCIPMPGVSKCLTRAAPRLRCRLRGIGRSTVRAATAGCAL
jgi:hypothetical protein